MVGKLLGCFERNLQAIQRNLSHKYFVNEKFDAKACKFHIFFLANHLAFVMGSSSVCESYSPFYNPLRFTRFLWSLGAISFCSVRYFLEP